MPYQSFDEESGSSKTEAKFQALNLPPEFFSGKRVLDLGCNEGAFCGRALSLGADLVVGIERNADAAEAARSRFPGVTVLNRSWAEPLDGEFDVVLFLSAIHYDPDKLGRLKAICTLLSPDGTFVLECGVGPGAGLVEVETHRRVGTVSHPTRNLWLKWLSEAGFVVAYEGRSVDQAGDPVPRYVFHCRKFQKSAILLSGQASEGKTSLARALGHRAVSLDHILYSFDQEHGVTGEDDGTFDAPEFLSQVRAFGLQDGVVGYVADQVAAITAPVLLIEGYALTEPWLSADLAKRLSQDGWRLWSLIRFVEGAVALETDESLLADLDPNPVVRVKSQRHFSWRGGASTFLLHPPHALEAQSTIEWRISRGSWRTFDCELSLPIGAEPVRVSLTASTDGVIYRNLAATEIKAAERRRWLAEIPDEVATARTFNLRLISQRASTSTSAAKSWLIVSRAALGNEMTRSKREPDPVADPSSTP
jgi:SAM-dependent methyltransferase